MICYHCKNVDACSLFRQAYSMFEDFEIFKCKNYDEGSKYKYRLIAKNDNLFAFNL